MNTAVPPSDGIPIRVVPDDIALSVKETTISRYGSKTGRFEGLATNRNQRYNLYSVGGFERGIPDVLAQGVPHDCIQATHTTLRRVIRETRLGKSLFTDMRIFDSPSGLHFRVVEVTDPAYQKNLLLHVMTDCDYQEWEDFSLPPRIIFALIPWYADSMESWAQLPPPPGGSHPMYREWRDKIVNAYLCFDGKRRRVRQTRAPVLGRREGFAMCAPRIARPTSTSPLFFSKEEVEYFAFNYFYFLDLFQMVHPDQFLSSMPADFRRGLGLYMKAARRSKSPTNWQRKEVKRSPKRASDSSVNYSPSSAMSTSTSPRSRYSNYDTPSPASSTGVVLSATKIKRRISGDSLSSKCNAVLRMSTNDDSRTTDPAAESFQYDSTSTSIRTSQFPPPSPLSCRGGGTSPGDNHPDGTVLVVRP